MDRPTHTKRLHSLRDRLALQIPLPKDAEVSLPVPVQKGGSVLDAVFFHHTPKPLSSITSRPFAWALSLRGDKGWDEIVQYARCDVFDFIEAGARLSREAGGQASHRAPDKKEYGRLLELLLSEYESLRTFAFSDELTFDQESAVRRYGDLFLQLAAPGHLPYYKALSPAFFPWLGLGGAQETRPAVSNEVLILQTLQELSRQFHDKIEGDTHRQQLVDEMHAELQQYKNGLIDSLTRPMENDIIKLIEDIGKSMELYRSRRYSPDNYRRLFALCEGLETDLCDLLYRHGTEPYTQEGDDVVVGRQKVLSTIDTDKPRLDKKVAVRHARGWEKNGKVIRPERISAYVCTLDSKDDAGKTPPEEQGAEDSEPD